MKCVICGGEGEHMATLVSPPRQDKTSVAEYLCPLCWSFCCLWMTNVRDVMARPPIASGTCTYCAGPPCAYPGERKAGCPEGKQPSCGKAQGCCDCRPKTHCCG